MSEWKGWALAETALYLDQPRGSEHVGLFMQYGNDHHQVGGFLDVEAALEFQGWLDTALTAVGAANAELVQALRDG